MCLECRRVLSRATAEFARAAPRPTRNPHDRDDNLGGCTRGSAAAVAAGMVPVALGSQTLGSVVRPAAFCANEAAEVR
jgi:Asp-tRNA(Asn)/Glu-tRNA(Gln) amidotransferase A subunit family amidase